VAIDTGEVTPLVTPAEGVSAYWPSWSADGRRIYFLRTSAGKDAITVERDLASGQEREFPGVPNGIASPTGPFLLSSPGMGEGGGRRLEIVPVDGGTPRVIYSASEGTLPWPNWTPDGKHVLVKHVGNGRDDVLLVPVDGSAPRKLDLPGALWGWLSMHPDGERIAYLAGKQEERSG
jgi:Tol biopolymer transport system component